MRTTQGKYYAPMWRRMRKTPLLLALAAWICSVPIVLLVALRFMDWQAAWYLVGGLLVAWLAVCWLCCVVLFRGHTPP